MEAGDLQRCHRNGYLRQLVRLGTALALAGLADVATAQPVDITAEWRAFDGQLTDATDAGERQRILAELAAWFDEATLADTDGFAEALHEAAFKLASDRGWEPGLDKRVHYFDEAAGFAVTAKGIETAAYAAFQGARYLAAAQRLSEACIRTEGILSRFEDASQQRPWILLNLAEWRRILGRHGAALRHLEAFELAEKATEVDQGVRLRLPLIRAQTYIDMGVPDLAGPWARDALRRARARRGQANVPARELILANRISISLARATGDHAGAIEAAEACLADRDLYKAASAEVAQLRSLAGISHLALEHDDPSRAERGAAMVRESIREGLPAAVEVFARFALVQDALRRDDTPSAKGELESAARLFELWDANPQQSAPVEAPATMATFEVRLALARGDDLVVLRALAPKVEAALTNLLETWARAPELEGGVGFLLYGRRRAVVGELIRLTLALEGDRGPELALGHLLRVQAQGTLTRRDQAPTPTLAEVQSALIGEGGGMLVYLPADGTSHVFVIDNVGIEHVALEAGCSIELARLHYVSHLIAARSTLGDPAMQATLVNEERRHAQELARMLLPERVRSRVEGWAELTIVGTDSLGHVPFAWLPLGDEPYLGARRSITYLHSLPLAVARAQRPRVPSADWDLMLVTGVEPCPELSERWPEVGPLPAAPTLADVYSERRTQVLTGDQATLASLEQMTGSSVRVFQFLGHAVRDRGRERPTALVLSPGGDHDGLVWCDDVQRLTPADVVVLTACRSGQGVQRRGDPGVSDMGGAWFSSGARAVVLTHAGLTYAQAQHASERLHESMSQHGGSPAEGLRNVRADLVRDHRATAPLRSALLYVVGLGHEAPFPGAARAEASTADASDSPDAGLSSSALAIAVGAVLVALGLWLASRRRRRAA